MRFFLDHDVPAEVARVLKAEGHVATELRDVLDITSSDEQVFAHAIANKLLLVTCNRDDFLALAARQPHAGLIIFDPPSHPPSGMCTFAGSIGPRQRSRASWQY